MATKRVISVGPQQGRGSNEGTDVVVVVEPEDELPDALDVDPVVGAVVVDGTPGVTVSGFPYWSSGGVVGAPAEPPRNVAITWLAVGSCTISTSSLPYGA